MALSPTVADPVEVTVKLLKLSPLPAQTRVPNVVTLVVVVPLQLTGDALAATPIASNPIKIPSTLLFIV
jgi:hypothetical protein